MHTKPDLRVFLKWMIAGSGSVITDVIPLGFLVRMQFNLRTLFLITSAAALMTVGFIFLAGSNRIKSVGHRTLHLHVDRENALKSVSTIHYATLKRKFVDMAIETYPNPEINFTELENDHAVIDLMWASTSTTSGKEISYHEYFDTILCRIVYDDQTVEFRSIPVSQNNKQSEPLLKL